MENNQDNLRNKVLRRCTTQKEIAAKIGVSKEYFNAWLKGNRNLSNKTSEKVESWLKE